MCICMTRYVSTTMCMSLFTFSSLPRLLLSAFGYSSNRFPLSHTANDDNEKDYHNNNCCNISFGYLVMWTARASNTHGATASFLYYTCSLHCSTRWGCFSADTGLTEH